MKVFNINKGIGYASSGVEYAQKYRRELLDTVAVEDYYVFLDYLATNITVFTDLMGFDKENVIWIYNYLSQRENTVSTYTVEQFLETLGEPYEKVIENNNLVTVRVSDFVRYELVLINGGVVDQVRLFENGHLLRSFHYDQTLNNFEDFYNGQLVRRVFFKSGGTEAFQQFYHLGEISTTLIDGRILYGLPGFIEYFLEKINPKPNDAVIIDRSLDVIETVLPALAGKTRMFAVVHAEHYNENLSVGKHILWNNHYEYVFEKASAFEALVVSTERQKEVLSEQLGNKTKIEVIPVGYIARINARDDYSPANLVTASRLATEKHIDVIIKAVVAAKRKLPALSLDIYGEGSERTKLENLIQQLKAQDYIHLKGHKNLTGIYGVYGGYVSASTSEGFGLSLLEATGESLPIIGADVDYGNREFINNRKNGLLYPNVAITDMPNVLEEAILEFYNLGLSRSGRPYARQKAKAYLKGVVAAKWEKLLLGKAGVSNEY